MKKHFFKRAPGSLVAFLKTESASGVVLGICAVVAMLLANSPISSSYFDILHAKVLGLSIQHWINDGLMTIFFFVIGMEIKKEILVGELSSLRKAALPIAAAIGGMVVPALIYFSFNSKAPNSNGWGIPMATDIAFALGVLTLFGKRVPLSLKIFLLALAIVDDLGAVLVIALFYTKQINILGLGLAAFSFAVILVGRKLGTRSYYYYLALGAVAWFGFLYSGVHATVAGVILGLMTPFKIEYGTSLIDSYSPLEELIHKLHPLVSFGIMPIFALANAGISIRGVELGPMVSNPIHLGILFGLLIGKPVGITLFSYLAVRLGLGQLPENLKWKHIIGVAFLGGIGFTMALFISGLALSPEQEIFSKTGIMLASVIAALLGSVVLTSAFKRQECKIIH